MWLYTYLIVVCTGFALILDHLGSLLQQLPVIEHVGIATPVLVPLTYHGGVEQPAAQPMAPLLLRCILLKATDVPAPYFALNVLPRRGEPVTGRPAQREGRGVGGGEGGRGRGGRVCAAVVLAVQLEYA